MYVGRDPALVGLGLAAVRDTISYAKYDDEALFPVERGLAVGISQTGRFLRHFLHQGFNADEHDRRAFDGLLVHTAGAGRGSFNHRFAQPSRDAHRYSAFFYPTDLFPFAGRVQRDPVTGVRGGLLEHPATRAHQPRVFYTNTGYEYWGRAAALLHVSVDGAADVEPLADERIYHLASTQHFPVRFPPRGAPAGGTWRGNPIDFLRTERALLAALQDWVETGVEPPPSRYPRVDAGELVPLEELEFPDVPGLTPPSVAHEAYRADYGPRWSGGIVDLQPPALGAAFPVLVPAVDPATGNELGGVPTLETLVPLATYTPWHVRSGLAGGNGELTDFYGSYRPFPRTEEERVELGDPRPAIASTWPSREAYLDACTEAAARLVDDRWLLAEDVESVLRSAGERWDWIHAR